jgi:hypothetical protein
VVRVPYRRRSRVIAAVAGWGTLLLATGLLSARAADPRITVRMDPQRIPVGGDAVLTVTLEGFSNRSGQPQVPIPEGVDIYESGRSTNMSWVNGRFASSTTYSYAIRARREGSYALGPVQVEDKGTLYRSESIALEVVTGGAAGGGSSAAGGAVGRGSGPASGAVREEARAADVRGLFARVVVDDREAYLDEQVTVRFQLYQRDDVMLLDIGGFEPPATEGFWREDLGAQRDYTVKIEGESYRVREVAWALFPTRPGDLEIGAGRIICQVPTERRGRRDPFEDFFGSGRLGGQNVPLTTSPVRVHVLPLPEAGRPASFTGSVGDYAIAAQVDVPQVHQGEPFTITATVSGAGHVQTIGQPVWPDWKGLRVYDSGEAVNVTQRNDRVTGEKSFKQVLVASRAGAITLDPVRFTFFDPERKRYVEIASDPLTIQALPGMGGAGGVGESGVALGEDILYIHTNITDGLRAERVGGLPAGALVNAVPLVLLAASWAARRRQLALERDPVMRGRQGALRDALRCLRGMDRAAPAARSAAGLAEVLEEFLGAWLGVPVRGMVRGELRARLGDAGLAEDAIARTLAFLEWSDEVRFGAGAETCASGERAAELERLLGGLDDALRRGARGGAGR